MTNWKLWASLTTASLCLTAVMCTYSHGGEERRDTVCEEVTEQLRQARDRGDLSSRTIQRIINNCYRSNSGMWSRLH